MILPILNSLLGLSMIFSSASELTPSALEYKIGLVEQIDIQLAGWEIIFQRRSAVDTVDSGCAD
jgi:hypothetical protein